MTTQAVPSFDAEYARVLKAAESAQALARDRETMINAANAALDAAGVARDLPLVGRVAALTKEYDNLSRQLAELTHLVGTETPIAALDLATTWRAERAHIMEQIEGLKRDVAGWERTANGDERS